MKRCVGIALLAWAGAAGAADTTVRGPLDLRADRYSDAAIVARVADGVRVDALVSEAGWVQVRHDGKVGWVRATGLDGDGATVASLARLDSGRSASGNLVVAAGIRRIPRASKHALIVAVETVDGIPRSWPGVADDARSARLVAERLGVAPDEIDQVPPGAPLSAVLAAIDETNARVRPADQLLVFFSGPGTQVVEDGACVPAWAMADGKALTASMLVTRLRPALARADKVLVVSDAAYGSPGPASRKTVPTPACAKGPAVLPIVALATAAGVSAQNVVTMQSAPGADQGIDVPHAGGVFTQAWADCFLGDAVDLDRSTSISIAEVAGCIDRRGRGAARVAVSGNAAWSPIVGVASTQSASDAATSPRAVIDDLHARRDGRIDVTLTATPSTLRIGRDFLDLALTSSRAGFVYLVLLGSDGRSFDLLFPNDLDPDNRIAAGETLRLPRPAWRVQGQGPAGRDTILAIVAESARDVVPFATRRDGPFGTAATDVDGRARLQWLLGRSGEAASSDCVDAGRRRNLAAVPVCSDAFGSAVIEVVER